MENVQPCPADISQPSNKIITRSILKIEKDNIQSFPMIYVTYGFNEN